MNKNTLSYRLYHHYKPGLPIIFLVFMLSCFCNTTAYAQTNNGIIQGTVQDEFNNSPVEYVTVAVQHARFPKVLNGTITDEKGRFKITGMAPGQYRLKFSFVGYEDKLVEDVTIKEDDILTDVGSITLSQGIGLEEVEVVGKRSLIEQHFDKIVYNTEEDIATGQTLNDMLRKVPMVSVDAQGNVSLRGSTNIQVLIDGKPASMFASNISDALKAIPPDQVKKIEVITMPSARYDAEGTAGVINIITKQAEHRGYNYSINLSGGNQVAMGNASFRAKGQKIGFNASVGTNNMFMPPMQVNNTRLTTTDETSTTLEQVGNNNYQLKSLNTQIGLDYNINNFHELSAVVRYTPQQNQSSQNTAIQLYNNQVLTLASNRNNELLSHNESLQGAVDYRRKFRNPDMEWNSSFRLAQEERNTVYDLIETDNKNAFLDEQGDNRGNNREWVISTDYLQTVSDKFKFEAGGKFISRTINTISTHRVYDVFTDSYLTAASRSFQFPYQQEVAAAYAEGNWQLISKWTLRTGLRLEHTNNQINEHIRNNYTNLAPSLALNFMGESSTWTLSYARRLSRPGLSYLNPFENRSDPLNWRTGNPSLLPEIVNAYDLNISQPIKKAFINASIYYHQTHDVIERQTRLLSSERTLTTYNNIGDNYRLGINLFLSTTIGENINLKAGGNLIYYHLNNPQLASENINRGTQITSFAMLSKQLNKGWTAEVVGAYLTPPWTAQQKNGIFYTYQLNLKKDILTTGSLSLTLVNPFHASINILKETTATGLYYRQQLAVPLRMINLGFQYNFSKNLAIQPTKNDAFDNDDQKQEEGNKPY